MPVLRDLLLVLTGVAGGLTGSVAGLASVITYPALLACGLGPIGANVTNTTALVFSGVGATLGSRPELRGQARRLKRLVPLGMLGGLAGATAVLLTSSHAFGLIVPWLIFAGAVVILFSRRPAAAPGVEPAPEVDADVELDGTELTVPPPATVAFAGATATASADLRGPPRTEREPDPAPLWLEEGRNHQGPRWDGPSAHMAESNGLGRPVQTVDRRIVAAIVAALSFYCGYFGAAGGVLLLAGLLATTRDSLARANAAKNVILGSANLAATVVFIFFGPLRWGEAVPLGVGCLVGSRLGPMVVRRAPAGPLRAAIAIVGIGLAAVLAYQAY